LYAPLPLREREHFCHLASSQHAVLRITADSGACACVYDKTYVLTGGIVCRQYDAACDVLQPLTRISR